MAGKKGRSGRLPANDHEGRLARREAGSRGGMARAFSGTSLESVEQRAATIGELVSQYGDSEAARMKERPIPEWARDDIEAVRNRKKSPVELGGEFKCMEMAWSVVAAKCDYDKRSGKLLDTDAAFTLAFSAIDTYRNALFSAVAGLLKEYVPTHEQNAVQLRMAEAAKLASSAVSEHLARGTA